MNLILHLWFINFSVVMFVQTITNSLSYKNDWHFWLTMVKFGLTLEGFGWILSDVRPLYPLLSVLAGWRQVWTNVLACYTGHLVCGQWHSLVTPQLGVGKCNTGSWESPALAPPVIANQLT